MLLLLVWFAGYVLSVFAFYFVDGVDVSDPSPYWVALVWPLVVPLWLFTRRKEEKL